MPTNPSTTTGWLVVFESMRPTTDIGAWYAGPVTARADEMYCAPARSPSSDGTPTNGSVGATGKRHNGPDRAQPCRFAQYTVSVPDFVPACGLPARSCASTRMR